MREMDDFAETTGNKIAFFLRATTKVATVAEFSLKRIFLKDFFSKRHVEKDRKKGKRLCLSAEVVFSLTQ